MHKEAAPGPPEIIQMNPEQIIANYHAIGPLADPNSLPKLYFETSAAALLAPPEEQKEPLMWLARQNRSDTLGKGNTPETNLEAASMLGEVLYTIDPGTAHPAHKALLVNSMQSVLGYARDYATTGEEKIEAIARLFDVQNWLERNQKTDVVVQDQAQRAVSMLEAILDMRTHPGRHHGPDGITLEVAVQTMQQYKLWQLKQGTDPLTEDPNVYIRLATRREDKPARGIEDLRKRTSHDIVTQLGPKKVRVQVKQTGGEQEYKGEERQYDKRYITLVYEAARGKDLDKLLENVRDAYLKLPGAAEKVDAKLKEYGLLDKIEAARRSASAGHAGAVALVGAANP